jgi:hypothetical protein
MGIEPYSSLRKSISMTDYVIAVSLKDGGYVNGIGEVKGFTVRRGNPPKLFFIVVSTSRQIAEQQNRC